MAGTQVVVVGSYNRDVVLRVSRFPAPGEPRLSTSRMETHGGKGSNQAVQGARCGAAVALLAATGDDVAGEAARALWAAEGIDATGSARLADARTLALGAGLAGVGFAGLALTRSIAVYLVAEVLIGIAFSLTTTVPGVHVVTGLFRRRSTMLGAYFTIGGLGQVAGPLMYVAIEGRTHQWRDYWWVFVASCAVLGLFATLVTSDRRERIDPAVDVPPEQVGAGDLVKGLQAWTVRLALKPPQYYLIVGAYTMYLLINTTAHGFALEHLRERGVDPRYATTMLSVEALIGAGIAVLGGVLGEKVSAKRLLEVSLVSLIVGMTGLAFAYGYALMAVYAVGVGIGYGLTFLASTLLLLNYFGKRANLELYSIMSLISTLATVGPAFGGWARDSVGGFQGVFLLCALATLLMLVATAFMTPPRRPALAKRERADGAGVLATDPA